MMFTNSLIINETLLLIYFRLHRPLLILQLILASLLWISGIGWLTVPLHVKVHWSCSNICKNGLQRAPGIIVWYHSLLAC